MVRKDGIESVGEIRKVQTFSGDNGLIAPPMCELVGCKARSKYLYADENRKGFCVCVGCDPMPEPSVVAEAIHAV